MRRHESPSAAALVRDIVEVIAIVAAGAWAIYTFIYVERIKPAADPPSLVMSGTLHKLGERKGLTQFSYDGTIRNNGNTNVYLIGEGYTVIGFRLASNSAPVSVKPYPGSLEYDRDARIESQAVIYRRYALSRFASPKFGGGYEMFPGQQVPFTGLFAVKSGEFDSIALYGGIAYGKDSKAHPTVVAHTNDGAVYFMPVKGESDYNEIEATLDRASLW